MRLKKNQKKLKRLKTIEVCIFILAGAALIGYTITILLGAQKSIFRDMWARFFQPYMPLRPREL
ncbi:hypothetical protein [Methanosarcina acetivorans]|uniref:hypothetical protein n=1 Tax=Methanosarcina acetivorans TaxID=2214 RepID=UPI0012FF3E09|nr:hypothetical protein [Methanosarcina acetivorans]